MFTNFYMFLCLIYETKCKLGGMPDYVRSEIPSQQRYILSFSNRECICTKNTIYTSIK